MGMGNVKTLESLNEKETILWNLTKINLNVFRVQTTNERLKVSSGYLPHFFLSFADPIMGY